MGHWWVWISAGRFADFGWVVGLFAAVKVPPLDVVLPSSVAPEPPVSIVPPPVLLSVPPVMLAPFRTTVLLVPLAVMFPPVLVMLFCMDNVPPFVASSKPVLVTPPEPFSTIAA